MPLRLIHGLWLKLGGSVLVSVVVAALTSGTLAASQMLPYDLIIAGLTFTIAICLQNTYEAFNIKNDILTLKKHEYKEQIVLHAIAKKVGINVEKIWEEAEGSI